MVFDYDECFPKWSKLEGCVCDALTVIIHCQKINCDAIILVTDSTKKTLTSSMYSRIAIGSMSSRVGIILDYLNRRGCVATHPNISVVTWDEKGLWTQKSYIKNLLENSAMLFLYYSGHSNANKLIIPHFRHSDAFYVGPFDICRISLSTIIQQITKQTRSWTPLVCVIDTCDCDGLNTPFHLTNSIKENSTIVRQISRLVDYDIYEGRYVWSISSTNQERLVYADESGSYFTNLWFASIGTFTSTVKIIVNLSHPLLCELPLWFRTNSRSDIRKLLNTINVIRYSATPVQYFLSSMSK